jgi:hypothetical protein
MASVEHMAEHAHHGGKKVDVIAHLSGHPVQEFQIGSDARLLDVMDKAAKLAGVALLPPKQLPFDLLHSMNGEQRGPVIEDIEQSLAEYLQHAGHKPHFAIELARTLHVTARWDVAPKKEMSPREILSLPRINLDYTKFTLYRPGSKAKLPLDEPIEVRRGLDLEAQSDGSYGGGIHDVS